MRTATLIVLAVAAGCNRAAPPAAEPGPGVRVTASYPGANAKVVADTVAAPIEQQVDGVEGAVLLASESRDDGSYNLVVRFKPGTDSHAAAVLVQNRLALAQPMLPDEVRRVGATVDRTDPDRFPELWVAVSGAEPAVLAGVAARARDELFRLPGVWGATPYGAPPTAARVWLDPDKLADFELTAGDVVQALRAHNLDAAAGRIGVRPAPVVTVTPAADLDAVAAVVVRTRDAAVVRVRDVGKVEPAPADDRFARVDDRPAVLLAVTAGGDATPDAVRKKLAGLDPLPKGVRVELVADHRRPGLAVVELRLADGTSRARGRDVAERVVKAVRALPGAPECLSYSEPDGNRATVLVKPAANTGPSPADVRKVLADLKDACVRVSDLAAGRPFPVRLALSADDPARLRAWADAVAAKLAADGLALDPDVFPGADVARLFLEVDPAKAAKLGVRLGDLHDTFQAHLGAADVYDFGAGRAAVVGVGRDKLPAKPDDLKDLKVRAAGGDVVRVGAVADVREVTGPPAVLRVNGQLALRITAALPPGKSVAEVTAACRKVAEAVAPKGGTVTDLSAAKAR